MLRNSFSRRRGDCGVFGPEKGGVLERVFFSVPDRIGAFNETAVTF